MKKLFMVLIMVVFGFVTVAKEVVVMTSNNTKDAFNRMYSVGTTNNVVVVNDVALFNEVGVPTYASAQVDGNKMTFVRGNVEFASYAVKFVKETRTTYVFVSSNESAVEEVAFEEEISIVPVSEVTTNKQDFIDVARTYDLIGNLVGSTLLVALVLLSIFVVFVLINSALKTTKQDLMFHCEFLKELVIATLNGELLNHFICLALSREIKMALDNKELNKDIAGVTTTNVVTEGINYEVPAVKLDLNNSLNLTAAKNLSVPVIGIFKVGNSVTYKGFNFVIVAEEINSYRCWNGTHGFFNICKSDLLEGHVINYTMHFEEVCELFMPKDNGPDNKGPKVVSLEITNSEVEYLTPNFDLVVDSSINFIGGLCQHLADYDFHELYEIFENPEGNCFWVFGIKGNNWKVMNMTTGEVSLLDRNSKRHIYSSILTNFKGWFKVGDSVGYKGINFLIIAENPDCYECYGKGKFFKLSKHEDLPGSVVNYNIGLKEIAEIFENK